MGTKILVALPDESFSRAPELQPLWDRLAALGEVRRVWRTGEAEMPEHLGWAEAAIQWWWPTITDAFLDAAPGLRFLGRIDIGREGARLALARGLAVSTSRGGWSPAVAEMALALMLGTLRRVSDYHAAMRAGTEAWVERFPGDIDRRERELTGRAVGIIGFGGVGRRLAELLGPFAPRLRVVDPYVTDEAVAALGGRRTDVAELVRESDVVVLSAASTGETRHILGASEIEAMRSNAVLVNVARAALVDTEALAARLRRGDLFAAVDVFDREPLDADSALRALPNAYLTPHRAGGILASVQRVVGWLVDDLEAFLAGRPLRHALTSEMVSGLDG
jgi:phosphoglycerate dehydrogenase-like enzyme